MFFFCFRALSTQQGGYVDMWIYYYYYHYFAAYCKVGIGICYDMRFAEMAQIYSQKGQSYTRIMVTIGRAWNQSASFRLTQ